jgi:hypothetical protein
MSAWKPVGYPSMSLYLICNRQFRIIFYRFDSGGASWQRDFNFGLMLEKSISFWIAQLTQ